jgi:hypothetical protein
MITIEARNVNDALWAGGSMLRQMGVQRDSRNGPVLVAPAPVSTVYMNPVERVMLHPGRDANPFFHLVEALWMLAGRKDLATLTEFVKNMANFSDDGGKTQPGAYGFRWRHQFDYRKGIALDQLQWAVRRLKTDPDDRRVVIQMWDPAADAHAADNGGKDVPCNLIALPAIGTDGRLNLTVYNRSNDMVWGAYGANAVHFSVLQEYLAAMIGVPVGQYWQVANNFHAYLTTLGKAGEEWPWGQSQLVGTQGKFMPDPYTAGRIKPMPMFEGLAELEALDDIEMFLKNPARVGIRSEFLRKVACPMVMAHRAFKRWGGLDGISSAREVLDQMPKDNDWRAGAELWMDNREAKLRRAQDDGVSHAAED